MNTNRRYTLTKRDQSIVRSGSDAVYAKPEAFLSVFVRCVKRVFRCGGGMMQSERGMGGAEG